jgi:hypothetical protein
MTGGTVRAEMPCESAIELDQLHYCVEVLLGRR